MSEKMSLALDFINRHPSQAARILEELPNEKTAELFEEIPIKEASQILINMLPLHAAEIVECMSSKESAAVLASLKPGPITAILRHLLPSQSNEILERLSKRLAMMCALLLNYSATMVGAWMTPLVRSIPVSCTASEARQRIAERVFENFCRIYVIDDDFSLKGIISPERLVAADGEAPVTALMATPGYSLPARATLNSVADHAGWKFFDDLPVLDRDRKFVGVLRYTTLRTGLNDSTKIDKFDGSSDTMIGFVEASMMGVVDILNASLAPAQSESLENRRSIKNE